MTHVTLVGESTVCVCVLCCQGLVCAARAALSFCPGSLFVLDTPSTCHLLL
jgi:hypothetical protein